MYKRIGHQWAAEAFGGGKPVALLDGGQPIGDAAMNKLASETHIPEELERMIAELRSNPVPDWTIMYDRAMGAGDTYGPNNNGDYFSRYWLTRRHPTFVSNAHLFRYHQSQDPANAIGRVFGSGYNEPLDVVDLIIGAPTAQIRSDEQQAQAIGGYIATSMGARVPYDVCSICGNKARTRVFYCDHASKHMLRLIDGQLVFVDNPEPMFKDISIVVVGADPISQVLRKVAHQHAAPPALSHLDRTIIHPQARSARASVPMLKLAQWMERYPVEDIFATLDRCIGPVRPDEFLALAHQMPSLVDEGPGIPMVRKTASRSLPLYGEVDTGLAISATRSVSQTPFAREYTLPMSPQERQAYSGYRLSRDPSEMEYLYG